MMKPPMGPPPPRNPNPRSDPNPYLKPSTGAAQAASKEAAPVIPPDGDAADGSAAPVAAKPEKEAPEHPDLNPSSTPSGSKQRTAPSIPYSIPPWGEPPGHPFFFGVLKNSAIIYKLDVSEKVKQKVYIKVHVGDVIRFGQSSRLYIFQGPSEFMPPVANMKKEI